MNSIERRAKLFQKMNDSDAMDVEDIENGESPVYCSVEDCAEIAVEDETGEWLCADHYEKTKKDE
jgi:hypothetical protein